MFADVVLCVDLGQDMSRQKWILKASRFPKKNPMLHVSETGGDAKRSLDQGANKDYAKAKGRTISVSHYPCRFDVTGP